MKAKEELLYYFALETYSTTPANKMYAKPWIKSPSLCVEKVTIPRVNDRSLYGCIKILSWAHSALVKTSDLCITHNSGKVQVNSRQTYTSKLVFSRKVHKISRTREMCFWISNFTQNSSGLFYVISNPKVRSSERDITYPKYVPTSF